MLLLPSTPWPRESLDCEAAEIQFDNVSNIDNATPVVDVEPALLESKREPPLDPSGIISSSTLSLLSRTYSNSSNSSSSTTTDSCECSDTSSVDENLFCGSASESPRMQPTEDSAATSWELNSEHRLSEGNVTGPSEDDDEKHFSLSSKTVGATVAAIPLEAGIVPQEQRQPESQSQLPLPSPAPLLQGQIKEADLKVEGNEKTVPAEVENPAPIPTCVTNIAGDVTGEETQTEPLLQSNTPTAVTDLSETVPTKVEPAGADAQNTAETTSGRVDPPKPLKSALNTSRPHRCPSCHLYAPSSSMMFYLDAWLNQQHDIIRSRGTASEEGQRKKKVSWPSTDASLKQFRKVERWIQKGVHVYPHPSSRSGHQWLEYADAEESEESEESEEEEDCGTPSVDVMQEKGNCATPAISSPSSLPSARPLQCRDSDSESVSSSVSVRGVSRLQRRQQQQQQQLPTLSTKVRMDTALEQLGRAQSCAAPRSASQSSSSSSSSSASTSPSSTSPTTECAPTLVKGNRLPLITIKQGKIQPLGRSAPTPPKKFSSGVKVNMIGGAKPPMSSEHEAAVRIRGSDPIKHRVMIENYWQF